MTLILDWCTLNPCKFVFVCLLAWTAYMATLGAYINRNRK